MLNPALMSSLNGINSDTLQENDSVYLISASNSNTLGLSLAILE